ncbi:MAG TPA: hypothetical protein VF604_05635 [Pyrinomonadaceae bacterium]|jgi:hypothetical protein
MWKLGLFFLLFCGISNSFGQSGEKDRLKPKKIIETPTCESNMTELGFLNQYSKGNEFVLIISHTGQNEKKYFGERRLYNAKIFLTKGFVSINRTPESIIIAQGERVSQKGYLDFFVDGILELRIFFDKNQDFFLGTCVLDYPYEKPCSSAYDKLFYPCKGAKGRIR